MIRFSLSASRNSKPRRIVRAAFVLVSLPVAFALVYAFYIPGQPPPGPVSAVPVLGERLDAAPMIADASGVDSGLLLDAPATSVIAGGEVSGDPASEWKSRKPGKGGNILVTLDELGAFPYDPPLAPGDSDAVHATIADDVPTTPRIPAKFRALDGMKIATYGYMIPIDLEDGRINSFILVGNLLACCFGVMPEMNQWVHVTLAEGTTRYLPNTPVLVAGRMEVGERWEHDMVISIYRMTADTVRPLEGG